MSALRMIAAILGLLAMSFPSPAQTSSEYQLKAVFLYNFAHFVDWPATTLPAGKPFIIGVVGENHFGSALEETVKGETVNGRAIEVHYFKTQADVKPCHILFVSKSEIRNLKDILNKVWRYTLTVSDDDKFNEAGGIIRFYKEQNKIRLAINKTALDSTRLIVSSKLLRLGEKKD